MVQRLNAKDIKPELEDLISEASTVEPKLADRLRELSRWIKEKPPGMLMKKRLVMDFLIEIILDAQFWLKIKNLSLEDRQEVFEKAQLTPVDKYWFDTLFPKWFNESDPKLQIWKQKMMAGELSQSDADSIASVAELIKRHGGACLQRYILDLSMATDLAVSGNLSIPLCVQLTTVSEELLTDKKNQWEMTLSYWGIKRGLLVSFNPRSSVDLADILLRSSDELPASCYSVHIG